MRTTKAIREARAALATLEKRRTELATELARAQAAQAVSATKLERLRAKLARQPIIAIGPGGKTILTGGLGALSPSWLDSTAYALTVKGLTGLILDGKQGLAVAGAIVKIRTATVRLRIPTKDALAVCRRRHAATTRAYSTWVTAQRAERDAISEAFDGGERLTPEAIATTIATTDWLRRHAQRLEQSELNRLTDPQFGALAIARAHLAHAESRSAEPCPCATCARARYQAEYAAARKEAERQRQIA